MKTLSVMSLLLALIQTQTGFADPPQEKNYLTHAKSSKDFTMPAALNLKWAEGQQTQGLGVRTVGKKRVGCLVRRSESEFYTGLRANSVTLWQDARLSVLNNKTVLIQPMSPDYKRLAEAEKQMQERLDSKNTSVIRINSWSALKAQAKVDEAKDETGSSESKLSADKQKQIIDQLIVDKLKVAVKKEIEERKRKLPPVGQVLDTTYQSIVCEAREVVKKKGKIQIKKVTISPNELRIYLEKGGLVTTLAEIKMEQKRERELMRIAKEEAEAAAKKMKEAPAESAQAPTSEEKPNQEAAGKNEQQEQSKTQATPEPSAAAASVPLQAQTNAVQEPPVLHPAPELPNDDWSDLIVDGKPKFIRTEPSKSNTR